MNEIEIAAWRGRVDEKLRQLEELSRDFNKLSLKVEMMATKQIVFASIVAAIGVYLLGKFYLKFPI